MTSLINPEALQCIAWQGQVAGSGAEALAALQSCKKAEQTRWVIPPRSSVPLIVQFSSDDIGTFKELLAFEVRSCSGLRLALVQLMVCMACHACKACSAMQLMAG